MAGKHLAKKPKFALIRHLKTLGFTNRFAIYILFFLAAGLSGGFALALLSIKHQYSGALACWTVVFTPIGTATSIVLSRIVDKSRAENVNADGTGIAYAAAQAKGFVQETNYDDMPQI